MIESNLCSRRAALGAVAAGWLALSGQDPQQAAALRSRTVVFVRHAEKEKGDDKDPALTAKGRRRADRLASMFAAAGVTAAYTTAFRRTRSTVQPLAAKAGVEVTEYEAAASPRFASTLGEGVGETADLVVVAGHSNTVPQMVAALGGELQDLNERGWLADDEYDRLVIVQLCGPRDQRLRAVSTLDLRLAV